MKGPPIESLNSTSQSINHNILPWDNLLLQDWQRRYIEDKDRELHCFVCWMDSTCPKTQQQSAKSQERGKYAYLRHILCILMTATIFLLWPSAFLSDDISLQRLFLEAPPSCFSSHHCQVKTESPLLFYEKGFGFQCGLQLYWMVHSCCPNEFCRGGCRPVLDRQKESLRRILLVVFVQKDLGKSWYTGGSPPAKGFRCCSISSLEVAGGKEGCLISHCIHVVSNRASFLAFLGSEKR